MTFALVASRCGLGRLQTIRAASSVASKPSAFVHRHVGPREEQIQGMVEMCGATSLDDLTEHTIPRSIRLNRQLDLASVPSETALYDLVRSIAQQNKVYRSYIGTGYVGTIVPPVIQRNILENPGWYTQYTPYQPEVAQGRLESLLNFQTMISDLTGLPMSNASLLDEATAAAEAMGMCFEAAKKGKGIPKNVFFADANCHPQTLALIMTRASSLNIHVIIAPWKTWNFEREDVNGRVCGAIVQYPDTNGTVHEYSALSEQVHAQGGLMVVAADILALTMLRPPGEFGADVALGTTQRFGVPMGFGGPHAAYFCTTEKLIRKMPGRIVGISQDARGEPGIRLALQTREQHIRRAKATSNICTAQALLANISVMYAIYHGPHGLTAIAKHVSQSTAALADAITQHTLNTVLAGDVFDTLRVTPNSHEELLAIAARAESLHINLRILNDGTDDVCVTLDETVTPHDLADLFYVFGVGDREGMSDLLAAIPTRSSFDSSFARTSPFLTHSIFNSCSSETDMLRYIKLLESRDLSLCHSMIPLGSCTMKLNATSEMLPLTFPEFSNIHPFAPLSQTEGYHTLFHELEKDLCEITGYDGFCLQPNSGAQGEYTGLRVIRAYHEARGDNNRHVCLIPTSAHGTNPASAHMAGLTVVDVQTDEHGAIDMNELQAQIEKWSDSLACVMITYPSTYGVFDEGIRDICSLVHAHGGQVYLDGANLNAQVGLCRPGDYGSDVSHLNLHKTFCIPHGGGGPGMGPIGVKEHLIPFLPTHPLVPFLGGPQSFGTISGAPWSSSSILPISWAYLRLMGSSGLRRASEIAILNANYMAARLRPHYPILFTNLKGYCAHEFIIDVRHFQKTAGVEAADIAKRLQDYGFHAPTMSWPVTNTLMIEPTESESKEEMDRYVEALISIREEIREIEENTFDQKNNLLKNAPHPLASVTASEWPYPYSRERAAYPKDWLRRSKFWPSTARINDVFGDRHVQARLV